MHSPKKTSRLVAVTLLELLVVVLIIGILATIATGVYTGEVRRAKIAATTDLIRQLELAITRYEVDTGTLPPSGSGDFPLGPIGTTNTTRIDGSGYLQLVLVHSSNGDSNAPSSSLWNGSYINFQPDHLAGVNAAAGNTPTPLGHIDILDSWGNPILYVQNADYAVQGTNFSGGTDLFISSTPTGGNPNLPAPNPFVAQGETYYNSRTYQLISFGPDAMTLGNGGTPGSNFRGAGTDDITNFGY